ncbi:hypothetical protein GGR56DRAFT_605174 [Xylariaceae sp. FL0804]|nr:hypothetical protein GGR56DRAFT_605174 [Xylariaceae sp. FL0804]
MSSNRASKRSAVKKDGALDSERSYGSRNASHERSRDKKKKSREEPPYSSAADSSVPRNVKARHQPSLTPPTLSAGVYTFHDRRPSIAASSMGDLGGSYVHHPSAGYASAFAPDSGPPGVSDGQNSRSAPKTPFPQMLPLDPLQPVSMADTATDMPYLSPGYLSPGSYPSSSPALPLAPHHSLGHWDADVYGEEASVTDDSGAAWERHTRVYGGGVCLACMASGGHGHEGGFYGDNVPMDQRR